MPDPARSLSTRTALVTGAASGIGLAVATELGRRGARVIACDLPGEALARTVAGVPGASALAADLAVRDEVLGLGDRLGDVDILVNNAGLQHVSALEEFDVERWDRIIAVMLTAPFLLTRAVLPGQYRRRFGRVVNIASVHGLVASPFKAAYVSAKHGLLGLTKTVALEAAQHEGNFCVAAISPAYVRTPLVERQLADQARLHDMPEEEVLEKVLLTRNAVRRLIEPDEVSRAVAYLCDEAAWSMTGSSLSLDAGWLAH